MRNITVFLITLLLALSPLVVFAGIVPCGGSGQPECRICHLFVGTKAVVDFIVVGLATPLAVVMLIYGGIMMLISGGDTKKIEAGKKAITSAIWGLVIVYGAWLIVDTLLKAIAAGMGPGGSGTLGEIKGWGMWNEIPNCPL